MLDVKINVDKLNTKERKVKAQLAADEMKLVINSQIFRNLFFKCDFHGETSTWKNKTHTEIFEHIMSGAEVLNPVNDNCVDLVVDDYYTPTHTVGYTTQNDSTIYSNTKYFDSNSTKFIGSNYLHEWGHKLGFAHDYNNTARRDYSICYQLNKCYEKTWNQIFYGTASQNDKVLVCKRAWYGLKRCYWKPVEIQHLLNEITV